MKCKKDAMKVQLPETLHQILTCLFILFFLCKNNTPHLCCQKNCGCLSRCAENRDERFIQVVSPSPQKKKSTRSWSRSQTSPDFPRLPKWGPLFWLEFRPCFGGALPSKIEVIWVLGRWWFQMFFC